MCVYIYIYMHVYIYIYIYIGGPTPAGCPGYCPKGTCSLGKILKVFPSLGLGSLQNLLTEGRHRQVAGLPAAEAAREDRHALVRARLFGRV